MSIINNILALPPVYFKEEEEEEEEEEEDIAFLILAPSQRSDINAYPIQAIRLATVAGLSYIIPNDSIYAL